MGVLSELGNRIAGAIRAYHSSPHNFERFDLSKVGTGQGAQAFGRGLYFAENPAVSGQGGQYWQEFARRLDDTPEGHALNVLRANNFDRQAATEASGKNLADLDRYLAERSFKPDRRYVEELRLLRQKEYDLLASGKKFGPTTYEVAIKARPEQFLDWDKPLSQQSAYVQDVLNDPRRLSLKPSGPLGTSGWYGYVDDKGRLIGRAQTGDVPASPFNPSERGSSLYTGGGTWQPEEATQRLVDAGIPGIRYLDAGSRPSSQLIPGVKYMEGFAPTELTYNYVVGNDNLIDILAKYGIVGTLGAGGAATQLPTLRSMSE